MKRSGSFRIKVLHVLLRLFYRNDVVIRNADIHGFVPDFTIQTNRNGLIVDNLFICDG